MAQSILSVPIPPTPSPCICRAFSLLLSQGGAFAKEGQPGGGALSVFRTLKVQVAYGSAPTSTNICAIVSTCQREMTKRRMCMVREKVAVLVVKSKLYEVFQIL